MGSTLITRAQWESFASKVEDLRQAFPGALPDFPHSFGPYVLTLIEEGLDSDDAVDACAPDGADDCGIDGLIIDEKDHRIRCYQFKTSEDAAHFTPETDTFNKQGPRDLADALKFLEAVKVGGDLPKHNRALHRMLPRLTKAFGSGYSVLARLVVSGTLTPQGRAHYDETATQARTDGFEAQLIDRTELERLFQLAEQLTREPPESITIEFVPGKYFYHQATGILQGQVRVNQISSIMSQQGMDVRLLGQNYRYFLGTRGNVGRVNEQILATLRDPDRSKRFHLLNNGMRITCRSIRRGGGPDSFVMYRPQLVNGGQTAVCIAQEAKWGHDVTVDVKVISVEDDSALATRIARATNTQTAVEGWDFWSNDDFQRTLLKELTEFKEPWWYDIKRGEFETAIFPAKAEASKYRIAGTARGYRRIDPDELSKAVLCYTGKPVEARTRRKEFSEADGLYSEIFNIGLSAAEYLVAYRIYETVSDVQARFRRLWGRAEAAKFVGADPDGTEYAVVGKQGYRRYFTENLSASVAWSMQLALGRPRLGVAPATKVLDGWPATEAAVGEVAQRVVAATNAFATMRENILKGASGDPDWGSYYKLQRSYDPDLLDHLRTVITKPDAIALWEPAGVI